jgi:hypothetical protein
VTAPPVRAPVDVTFRATGVDGVRRGLKLIGGDAELTHQRVGGAARQIAGGVEAIARTGKASGEALKQIISQGAEMAFMFGAAGPIVGAISIVGLSIYEHITKGIQEAKDEAVKLNRELEQLDLTAAAKRQQQVFSGNPNAIRDPDERNAAFIARSGGLTGVRARIEELRPTIPQAFLDQIGKGKREFHGADVAGLNERAEEMGELLDQLTKLKSIEGQLGPIAKRLLGETVGAGERTRQADNAAAAKKEADDLREKIASQVNAGELIGASDRADSLKNLGPQLLRGIVGGFTPSALGNIKAEIKPILSTAQQQIAEAFAEQVQGPLENAIQGGLASTLSSAISDGVTAGFSGGGITGAFKAAGKTILAGLGGILKQMGEVWIKYGILMSGIGKALFNPFTSGPAAIAIGAALIALGSALGAVAQGRGGAGGSSAGGYAPGGGFSHYAPIVVNPTVTATRPAGSGEANALVAGQPVHFTIIGQHDPTVQRQILELMRRANSRTNG